VIRSGGPQRAQAEPAPAQRLRGERRPDERVSEVQTQKQTRNCHRALTGDGLHEPGRARLLTGYDARCGPPEEPSQGTVGCRCAKDRVNAVRPVTSSMMPR
jgi:hypothetical protein